MQSTTSASHFTFHSLLLFTHQIFHCHIKIHLKSLPCNLCLCVRLRTFVAICAMTPISRLDSFHQQIIINSCLKLKLCQISNNNFHNHFHSARFMFHQSLLVILFNILPLSSWPMTPPPPPSLPLPMPLGVFPFSCSDDKI